MKINDEGTSNAAHWYERAMKAESRLAEAERDLAEAESRLNLADAEVTIVLVRAKQRHQADQLHAALARLALAREWIEQTHLNECCAGKWSLKTGRYEECDCDRGALIDALEPPK